MKKLLLICILFLQNGIQAQGYTFTVTTSNYNNLTGNTSLNNGAVWDDPAFTFPIGFNFMLYNTTFNSAYIHPDGGGGTVTQAPIPSNTMPTLIPFSADLIDRGFITSTSLSNLSYKLDGAVGTRILKIEWNNAGFFEDLDLNDSSTDFVNFQVWLYETSNIVEFRFGSSNVSQPTVDFNGATGPGVAIFPFVNFNTGIPTSGIVLSGSPSNPTVNNTSDFLSLNGMPANGTVYRYTPTVMSVASFTNVLNGLNIYPNPTSDFINLPIIKDQKNFQISITNVLGKLVYFSNVFQNKIDVSNLEEGVYFIKLINHGNEQVTKFLKN